MDVRFYSSDFSRLGDFPRPLSVNIQEVYCGYGTAEVHFSLNETDVFDVLENNDFVMFCAEGHWAVVTGWQLGEDIALYGRTLGWLLTKRVVAPYSYSDITPEEAAINVVQSAEDFVATAECSHLGEIGSFESENPCTLYDGVCKALKPAGLGFSVETDLAERKLVFRVYEGEMRECILSASMRSACGMEYTVEKQNAASNCGWYKRKITNGESTDTEWVYHDDSKKTGLCKWEALLSGTKTPLEAENEISALVAKEVIDVETLRVKYGQDFNLGDKVRVQYEFGNIKRSQIKRVASVNIYFDVDKSGTCPTLEKLEE